MIDVTKGRELLLKQVGKPYIFGYEVKLNDPDPMAFDCSELVEWFYAQFGIKVPDGTWHQWTQSKAVTEPQAFDINLLLKNGKTPFHVVMKYDDDSIVHAKGKDHGVVKESNDYLERNKHLASGWRRFSCLIT